MKKYDNIRFAALFFILTIVFSNCGRASKELKNDEAKGYAETEKTKSSAASSFNEEQSNSNKDAAPTDETKTDNSILKQPQKIIKTANVSFRVEEVNESYKHINAIIKQHKAIISSENQENQGYRMQNNMVIRVLPENLDTLVAELLKEAIYLDFKKIASENVTAVYVDAQSRLKTKKEVELRYRELLKRANTIEEILNVERELRVIREEIEAFEGKLKVMDDEVSYSTINLNIYQEIKTSLNPDDGFFSKIWKAIKGGWKGLQILIVGLLYLWPLLLILGIGTYILMRYLKRNKKQ